VLSRCFGHDPHSHRRAAHVRADPDTDPRCRPSTLGARSALPGFLHHRGCSVHAFHVCRHPAGLRDELARTGRLIGSADLSSLLADTWEVHQVSLGVAIGFAILASVFAFRITGKVVRALEKVQRIHEAQNEYLSIVSHEFRTPLTGIQGFSELIRDEDLTPELMREYAADINSDARRLSRMIGDMLDAPAPRRRPAPDRPQAC
jgi:signal transduction histidine kinase